MILLLLVGELRADVVLSDKDADLPRLEDIPPERLPVHVAG